jgi:hypothetical protein
MAVMRIAKETMKARAVQKVMAMMVARQGLLIEIRILEWFEPRMNIPPRTF